MFELKKNSIYINRCNENVIKDFKNLYCICINRF